MYQSTFSPGDEEEHKFATKALLRTHLLSTFEQRIFSQVEHRVLALAVVLDIFGTVLDWYRKHQPKEMEQPTCKRTITILKLEEEEELLKLSFRLTAECKDRSPFVKYLTKLCLLLSSTCMILNHKVQLKAFWDDRQCDDIGPHIQAWVQKQGFSSDDTIVNQMDMVLLVGLSLTTRFSSETHHTCSLFFFPLFL